MTTGNVARALTDHMRHAPHDPNFDDISIPFAIIRSPLIFCGFLMYPCVYGHCIVNIPLDEMAAIMSQKSQAETVNIRCLITF